LKNYQQQGFTLVEIAAVLVIIGLLMAAIVQGIEFIDNSRIKKASSDIGSINAAFLSYQDRFKRPHGEVTCAVRRVQLSLRDGVLYP
jgi:prepilin-type N-terminal cleavage/methylation domain-containing protein